MDSEKIELVSSDRGKIIISLSTFNKIRNEQLESIMEGGKKSRILKLPYPTEVVARVVNYLRTDDPQLKSLNNSFQLYDLSRKYSIKILSRKCEKFIIDQLNMKNVCAIHDFACKMDLSQIQHRCWKIFDTYWTEIFEGDDFKSCETTTIHRLVSRPLYTSMSEVDIFLAVYNWIEEKCKREMGTSFVQMDENAKKKKYREELEPFLEKIRFLAMNKQELINKIFKLNLFTEEEEKFILVCKETKNFSDLFI
ncbi:BTB/POZ domain-containing protein 6-like [Centruroides sculpturatus]|uniref:BTB/POZ domain-containing protein 6-like n=1 Tax=Centruroides sculpturatus TaxID=218467 RepID=UPI000C6E43BB|nr:BTB/POZ domain-containing protein 6-like [Centruroides sculpturatus]